MEQIIRANQTIMEILGKAKRGSSGYRMIRYCMAQQVEDGVLLFNVLTRELLLLTREEYAAAVESEYLRDHWFVVPEETDEKKMVGLVRWIHKTMRKESKGITDYTILTTTDCNARCFYCYELGRSRIPMSDETALQTADFIIANCGGKDVAIDWFGGEPLYNYRAIDLICDRLRENGVAFRSSMISNGYLFNDELVQKAVDSWKLKWVQITLDGTEEVYNRYKAFIYREGSAYQVVTGNIARLLDAGIMVIIRLNVDFRNAEDLAALCGELSARFAGKSNLKVYPHVIVDNKSPEAQRSDLETWEQLRQLQYRLEDKLIAGGLCLINDRRLKRELPGNCCMADNESAMTVMPDGQIGRCVHFSDSESVGRIDSTQRDQVLPESWKERREEFAECAGCFYYPECLRLKKCPNKTPCDDAERVKNRRHVEQAMINEFHQWKKGAETEKERAMNLEWIARAE